MRWFILLPLNQAFLILAVLVTPLLPLFASKDGWLPRWLWWFQTPDFPLDGDEGFRTEHAPYRGDNLSRWQVYWNRCRWLWRNPAYGWDWNVLAYTPTPGDVLTVRGRGTLEDGPAVNDPRLVSGWLGYGGWYFARKGYAWQLFIRHRWSATHCTKLNFGWKLWPTPGRSRHAFVFSPTGFWKRIS